MSFSGCDEVKIFEKRIFACEKTCESIIFSSSENMPSTKSATLPWTGFPTPNLSLQKSAVPRCSFIERSPLCPPSPPDHIKLTVPSGSSI